MRSCGSPTPTTTTSAGSATSPLRCRSKAQAESRDAHAVDFTKILAVARGMLASAYDARGELDRAAGELDQAIGTLERLRGEGHLDAEGDEYLAEFRKQRAALARRTRRGP